MVLISQFLPSKTKKICFSNIWNTISSTDVIKFLKIANYLFEIDICTALIKRLPMLKVGIWISILPTPRKHTHFKLSYLANGSVWHSINHSTWRISYILWYGQPYIWAGIRLTTCCEGEKQFIWYLSSVCLSQLEKQLEFDLSDYSFFSPLWAV